MRSFEDAVIGLNQLLKSFTDLAGTIVQPSVVQTVRAAQEIGPYTGLGNGDATTPFNSCSFDNISWRVTVSGGTFATLTVELQGTLSDSPGAGDWNTVGSVTDVAGGWVPDSKVRYKKQRWAVAATVATGTPKAAIQAIGQG